MSDVKRGQCAQRACATLLGSRNVTIVRYAHPTNAF